MRKQKLSLISLLTLLGVIFNLNSWTLENYTLLHISLVAQLLITLSAILTIAIPINQTSKIITNTIFWVVVYLLVHLIAPQMRPLFGDINTYITFTELSLLILVSAAAFGVSYHQYELQRALDVSALLHQNKKILTQDESIEEIKSEFIRSRRHDRPLTIMVLEPVGNSLKDEFHKAIMQIQKMISERFMIASIGQIIIKHTRRTDMVVDWNNQGKFIVACPETEYEGCVRLVERIKDEIEHDFGLTVKYGIAAFPSDAITYKDLIKQAEGKLETQTSGPDSSILSKRVS